MAAGKWEVGQDRIRKLSSRMSVCRELQNPFRDREGVGLKTQAAVDQALLQLVIPGLLGLRSDVLAFDS